MIWIGKVLRSIRFALEGLKYTVVTQRNMRIHFCIALIVVCLSLLLPVSKLEVLVLFVAIILVLFAELINTAIEAVVDMVTDTFHPLAKVAKDVAAGAVLLTTGLAAIVGISIFYPYLNTLFLDTWSESFYIPNIGVSLLLVFTFFFTLFIKGWLHRIDRKQWEPSMTTSIIFCIAGLIIAMNQDLQVILLMILLLLLFLGTTLRKRLNRIPILFGMMIGSIVALIGMHWL